MRIARLTGVLATLAALALGTTACGSDAASPTPAESGAIEPQTASILMNWFAQAEQGGYWDAMENQYAKEAGVTLDVQQGGPGIQTVPQVASGQSDFGIANADEILIARNNGLPIVAVASAYDTNLQCMMAHASTGIDSFEDLNGHQVSRVPSPYFDYLKQHFKLTDIEDINYTGSLADFKRNTDLVQQCFMTSDVYNAEKEGIDLSVLSVAEDGGYNPYGLLLFTTEKVINEKPEVVQEVVQATVKGWENFLADPADAKTAISAANKDADVPTMDASAEIIKEGNYLGDSIGEMTTERWEELRDQLASIDQLPKDFDVSSSFTNDYLP